jgi:hypothetical protein
MLIATMPMPVRAPEQRVPIIHGWFGAVRMQGWWRRLVDHAAIEIDPLVVREAS